MFLSKPALFRKILISLMRDSKFWLVVLSARMISAACVFEALRSHQPFLFVTLKPSINNNLDDCYNKIYKLIQAEIKNDSKDYDKNFIRNHIEKLTS